LLKSDRIYIAGAATLIGAALVRELARQGYRDVIGTPEPELTDAAPVDDFFARHTPAYVFMAAGKSGGIHANQKYPADLMIDNLLVEANVIRSAHRHQAKKVLYLASSCSYPRAASQPMSVTSLMTGLLEPTNEAYAVAKLAGMALCKAYRQQYGADFIAGIPANAFGPGDDFTPENSHVVAALIRRIHEAQASGQPMVEVWGTGAARREFIFADDLANACVFVMNSYDGAEPINIGGGEDLSIKELATMIKEVVGYSGELQFDASKPDGMPLKSLDSGPLLEMGWRPANSLREGLAITYKWFLENKHERKVSLELAHVR
jgi:GDP-L-fucose synthase